MIEGLGGILRNGLAIKQARNIDSQTMMELFGESALQSLVLISPLFVLLVVIVIMTPLGLGGWSFSTKAISFKWEKLDPIKGMGRVFSARGLMELLKVLAKFLLVCVISGIILWSLIDEILGISGESLNQALAHVATSLRLVISCFQQCADHRGRGGCTVPALATQQAVENDQAGSAR